MSTEKKCFFQPLYQVATVVNSSLDPGTVFQKVVEAVARALSCKACTLRLLDRTGEQLLASASYGLSKGYLRKGKIELEKSGVDKEALGCGRALYIPNAEKDSRFQYPEAARAEGLVSILVAPLLVDDKPIGVLRAYTGTEREFSEEERDFLLAVTHIAAIAIENARLHEALRSDYELLTSYNYQIFED